MSRRLSAWMASLTLSAAAWFAAGCGPSGPPTEFQPASAGLRFVVPARVHGILKQKCFVCHGNAEIKGGFNLKEMEYQPEPEASWRPMDLAGVTRIKLAILPLEGKPARMPKRAGSIWNPLTTEEANAVAKWTDYPYEHLTGPRPAP